MGKRIGCVVRAMTLLSSPRFLSPAPKRAPSRSEDLWGIMLSGAQTAMMSETTAATGITPVRRVHCWWESSNTESVWRHNA